LLKRAKCDNNVSSSLVLSGEEEEEEEEHEVIILVDDDDDDSLGTQATASCALASSSDGESDAIEDQWRPLSGERYRSDRSPPDLLSIDPGTRKLGWVVIDGKRKVKKVYGCEDVIGKNNRDVPMEVIMKRLHTFITRL
jgi:hypothetical protein